MRLPTFSAQLERDVKRLKKRGKNMNKLKALMELLLSKQVLPAKYKDHPLKHNWTGYRDAHVESDWVLIYLVNAERAHFERTGTHEELFDKL